MSDKKVGQKPENFSLKINKGYNPPPQIVLVKPKPSPVAPQQKPTNTPVIQQTPKKSSFSSSK